MFRSVASTILSLALSSTLAIARDLIFLDANDEPLMKIRPNGNVFLVKGDIIEQATVWPQDARFAVKAGNQTVAALSTASGNLYLAGQFLSTSAINDTSAAEFLVKDIAGTNVLKADYAGNLLSRGDIYRVTPGTQQLADTLSIVIDKNSRAQIIDGFGGSLSSWGYAPKNATIDRILTELNVTILRTEANVWQPASLQEQQARPWTWPDVRFSPLSDRWTRALPALRYALGTEVGSPWAGQIKKLMLTFWAPPSQYKILQTPPGQYWYEFSGDNVGYAIYVAQRVASLLAELGVSPTTLEVVVSFQNEPSVAGINVDVPRWLSCRWTPSQVLNFIPFLRMSLNDAGLGSVKIAAPEKANLLESWGGSDYLDLIVAASSPSYKPDIIAYHLYPFNGVSPQFASINDGMFSPLPVAKQTVHDLNAQGYSVRSWQTETVGLGSVIESYLPDNPNIEPAVFAAECIHRTLVYAGSSAFLWWGLTWHGKGQGASAADWYGDDASGLMLLQDLVDQWDSNDRMPEVPEIPTTSPPIMGSVSKKYWAFAQFSKYVLPGFQLIDSSSDRSLVLTSAFISPDENRIVLVLVNCDPDYSVPVTLTSPQGYSVISIIRTDENLSFASIASLSPLSRMSTTTVILER